MRIPQFGESVDLQQGLAASDPEPRGGLFGLLAGR
jgi:hypothetical protein